MIRIYEYSQVDPAEIFQRDQPEESGKCKKETTYPTTSQISSLATILAEQCVSHQEGL